MLRHPKKFSAVRACENLQTTRILLLKIAPCRPRIYRRLLSSISSFLKLKIFHQFHVTPEWRVLKMNKSVRRRGSGCVPFRALGLRKPALKARPRHTRRVCRANSVVSAANEVLAESIALFSHTFKTRHSTYYIAYSNKSEPPKASVFGNALQPIYRYF